MIENAYLNNFAKTLQLPLDPIRDNSMAYHLQFVVFVNLIAVMLAKLVLMLHLDRGLDHD